MLYYSIFQQLFKFIPDIVLITMRFKSFDL